MYTYHVIIHCRPDVEGEGGDKDGEHEPEVWDALDTRGCQGGRSNGVGP